MNLSKVCVIGAGRWGRNHIRTLHEMGVLGAVVESNPGTVAELKVAYPALPIFADYRNPSVLTYDLFTVVVPAEQHFPVGKFLLENGKHVLIEKPITLRSQDAKALCDLASAQKKILMVGHLLLFHPAILKMKEMLQSGKLGKLQYLYSNRLNLGTVRKEENSLWSFAPHDISVFEFLIGAEPVSIACNGGAHLQPQIHDTTMTNLRYPDNVVGHIFVSWLHPFKEHRLVIIGSKGMLSFEDSSDSKDLLFYEKGIDWVKGEPVKRDGPTEKISYDRSSQPLKEELSHFIACVKGQSQNERISGEKGLSVLKVLEEANRRLLGAEALENEVKKTTEKPSFFVHETALVDQPSEVGEGSKIWHFSHVQPGARLGKKCILGQNVNVGPNVKIGDFVKIQNNVSIYEGVEIEDYVFCGPSMVFTNILNPRSKYPQAESKFYIKTLVREGASIGANATIVCGVTLGRFSFIGAGAVVTKDVPDYAIVVGNPGRVVGWMSEGGVRLNFGKDGKAFCERSKKCYVLDKGQVKEVENLPSPRRRLAKSAKE